MNQRINSFLARAAVTLLLLLVTTATAWADIIGNVDVVQGYNGSLEVKGWAIETGFETTPVRIHVQFFDTSGNNHLATVEIQANSYRADVGNISFHGFIPLDAGTYMVKFAALGLASSRYLTDSSGNNTFYPTAGSYWIISYDANGGSGAPGPQVNRWGIPSALSTLRTSP